MEEIRHTVAGDECRILIPTSRKDLAEWHSWMADEPRDILGLDTETTGLDVYTPGHKLRTLQVGDAMTAWVVPVEGFEAVFTREDVAGPLGNPRQPFVAHNAPYDMLVLDRHKVLPLDAATGRIADTRIFAHLLDPRPANEGGVGLGLKAQSAAHVDPDAPDTTEDLTSVFRANGLTKATGFAGIPLDNETYLRYAGLDVLLVTRLYHALSAEIKRLDLAELSRFEHKLMMATTRMMKRGMRVDVAYATKLRERLKREAEEHRATAAKFGVTSVGSGKQVSSALLAMGETLRETTPSGAPKVDKAVLLPLADLNLDWERQEVREPNPLADAVVRAKRADKWGVAYAAPLLEWRDEEDRLHPSINSLQARTARMSVSRPALQQLPSSDWTIRRAFIADEGFTFVTADYKAVEMRVLAALSGDDALKSAILRGEDIHDFTARMLFGPEFTKAQRKIAKAVGFGKVYGGGATTIQRQTGADMESVKAALRAYDETFPGIKRFARQLQMDAEFGRREVVTPIGRRLPLDRDRMYACVNYVVQSTARDILAAAIVRMQGTWLESGLLLPVHDELIAQAPIARAEEYARDLKAAMETEIGGVPIEADAEVVGRSWGMAYGATA